MSEQIAVRFPTLLKAGEKLCSCCRKRLSQTSDEACEEYESASTLPEVVEVTDRQEVEEEYQ